MGSAEDEALKAEIARLTGQIDQAKAYPASTSRAGSSYYQQPYSGYYGGAGSGSGSGNGTGGYYGSSSRGGYARGRGRGATPAGGPSGSVSRHRKLVLNNGDSSATSPSLSTHAASSTANASGSVPTSASTGAAAERATTNGVAGGPSSGWVKRKTTHNMSLVSADTFEKTEPARIAALQASQEAKAAARATKRASTSSSSMSNKSFPVAGRSKSNGSSAAVRRGDNMGEVIIDGVVFVFDETGTKLVKKAQQQPSSDSASPNAGAAAAKSSTALGEQTSEGPDGASKAPLRTSVNGQAFVRTKRGNLISAELLEKRKAQKESAAKLKRMAALGRQIGDNERIRSSGKKSRNKTLTKADQGPKGLCSFFTKTGQCKRGLSCPYAHDPAKLAICPGALRPTGCTQPAGLCPLSHSLSSPERIPHCLHFLRSAGKSCRNGEECRYVHPPAALTAEVLSKEDCPVCMDFARLGWCERGRGCTARHTFDCADFLEKGSCERKGCRLQHNVVAREKMSTGPGAARGGATGEHPAAAQGDTGFVSALIAEGDEGTEGTDVPPISSGFISANHGASKGSKRKRAGRAGEVLGLVEPQDEEEGISFVGGGKRKKAFQQKDFISFDDDDDDDDDDEEEEEDEGEDENVEGVAHAEGLGEVSEVDSVSSGEDDEESSDGESESDEDEDEQSDSDDSSSEGSSE